MFKNLKLSAKLGSGFAAIVAMAAILGILSWQGISAVRSRIQDMNQASACLAAMNDCAKNRLQFAISGFTALEDGKSAADRWQQSYDDWRAQAQTLSQSGQLNAEDHQRLASVLQEMEGYKKAFEAQKHAERTKDDAFTQWRKIGWEVTSEADRVMEKTIDPYLKKALEGKSLDQYAEWADIDATFNESVITKFLTLRVSAVFFAVTKSDEQWQQYQDKLKDLKSGMMALRAQAAKKSELTDSIEKLESLFAAYEKAGEGFHAAIVETQAANVDMANRAKTIADSMKTVHASLEKQMNQAAHRTNLMALLLTLAIVAVGAVFAYVLTRSITGMLRRVIAGLDSGSQQVSAASAQVAQSSQSMAEGASEQASSLEEVSSSLEEMASMTRQNADNAKQADAMAAQARDAVQKGSAVMARMSQAIGKIKESSDQTAKIVKTIDEIAFQTNLLALNAAVEAARAGEAGKGFAVVAEEVRNLAQRSAEAAKNTAALIEGSQKNADQGVAVSSEVEGILKQVGTSVQQVAQLIGEVTAASQEQAQGIDQINTAVAQMDKVTQSNAANAEESASASEELSAQARELSDMVNVLVAVVEGASRNGRQGSSQDAMSKGVGRREQQFVTGETTARSKSIRAGHLLRHESEVSGVKAVATSTKTVAPQVVKPEDVIPLDDEEIKDF